MAGSMEAELAHRGASPRGQGGMLWFAWGAVIHAQDLRRAEAPMTGYGTDLAHAARGLFRRPGFSLLAVMTLATGIGAATAIFSLAEAMLLRPLPLPEADRLVRVYSTNSRRGFSQFSVSYPDYADIAASGLFVATSLYVSQDQDLSGDGVPERIPAVAVHERFFQTLSMPFVLGRGFTSDDHDPGNGLTAVIAESFWARRFGSSPSVIGAEIRLDGVPHTVVGVVPDRAAWPSGTPVWMPLQWSGPRSVPCAPIRVAHRADVRSRRGSRAGGSTPYPASLS